MEQNFTVKNRSGQTSELHGDPNDLTLWEAIGQSTGKKGGQSSQPGEYKCRVNGRDYAKQDFNKSFSDLGISDGATIEVLEGATA